MKRPNFKITEEFRDLWRKGWTSAQLAEKYNITTRTVNARAKDDGLRRRPIGVRNDSKIERAKKAETAPVKVPKRDLAKWAEIARAM